MNIVDYSFENICESVFPPAAKMAQAGLFYLDVDTVQCAFCRGKITGLKI